MGAFVAGIHGVADACKGVHLKEHPGHAIPIIAGNVSLYNESKAGSIPPSPVIGCLGRLDNAEKAIDAAFKATDSSIILIGSRKDELGGSVYYDLHDQLGAQLPKPNLEEVQAQVHAMVDLVDAGYLLASHDISEGGVAVALAEMSFPNEIGFQVSVDSDLLPSKTLFSETGGFLIEVAPNNEALVLQLLQERGLDHQRIGTTTSTPRLKINDLVDLDLSQAKDRWLNGLREKLL